VELERRIEGGREGGREERRAYLQPVFDGEAQLDHQSEGRGRIAGKFELEDLREGGREGGREEGEGE